MEKGWRRIYGSDDRSLPKDRLAKHAKGRVLSAINVIGLALGLAVCLLIGFNLQWIVLSFLIACPLAWWCMQRWLRGFAYRTTPHWWIFVAAGLSCLGIAALTIGWQVVKAATANPVDRLRME
jgi:putative ABC transport system permease protein